MNGCSALCCSEESGILVSMRMDRDNRNWRERIMDSFSFYVSFNFNSTVYYLCILSDVLKRVKCSILPNKMNRLEG